MQAFQTRDGFVFWRLFLTHLTLLQGLIDEVVDVLDERVKASGRLVPIPKLSDRAQMRLDKETALQVGSQGPVHR